MVFAMKWWTFKPTKRPRKKSDQPDINILNDAKCKRLCRHVEHGGYMSIEQLKELFGNQEAILELVQLEGGELALRNAGSEKEPLVKIQFNDEVKAILGDQTAVVAQHMIQAALFGLLEKQVNEWHAEIVDEQPQFMS